MYGGEKMNQTKENNNKDKRPARLTGDANVFGNRLKELKEEHGFSFADIANMLDKSKTTIIGYSHGYRFPLMRDIEDLAKIFNTSVAYLIGETDIKGPPVTIQNLPQTLSELIKNGQFHVDGRILSEEELQVYVDFLEEELVQLKKSKQDADTEQQEKKA